MKNSIESLIIFCVSWKFETTREQSSRNIIALIKKNLVHTLTIITQSAFARISLIVLKIIKIEIQIHNTLKLKKVIIIRIWNSTTIFEIILRTKISFEEIVFKIIQIKLEDFAKNRFIENHSENNFKDSSYNSRETHDSNKRSTSIWISRTFHARIEDFSSSAMNYHMIMKKEILDFSRIIFRSKSNQNCVSRISWFLIQKNTRSRFSLEDFNTSRNWKNQILCCEFCWCVFSN